MVKQWRKCGGEEEGNDQQCGGELSVERRVVVGICRLPKSEKADVRYSRRILYNMCLVYFKYTRRMLYRMRLEYLALPPPGPPQLLEAHPTHMRLVYLKYTRRILQYAPRVLGHLPPPGPPNLFEAHPIHMRLK